ncbi:MULTISPECIES: hypothetical protein [unclassified Streptomyces]|uniref:hypothetical protein n=1 Tax=unclassified Streptomyces TaxID=2593676 RepID=UPI0036F17830
MAAGETLAVSVVSVGGALRHDLTTVPLDGVEPSHVVVATRAGDRGRVVTAFRKAAREHLTAPESRTKIEIEVSAWRGGGPRA